MMGGGQYCHQKPSNKVRNTISAINYDRQNFNGFLDFKINYEIFLLKFNYVTQYTHKHLTIEFVYIVEQQQWKFNCRYI